MQVSSRSLPHGDPQAEIRLLRETLLGGRGPGATPAEVLAHTRWRREVADSPVSAVPGRTPRSCGQPSALTVVLFAVLLMTGRRLRRHTGAPGRAQMPARAA